MMNQAGDMPSLQYSKGFCVQPARDANTVGVQFASENFGEVIIVPAIFDQFPQNLRIRALVEEDSDCTSHFMSKVQISYEMRAEVD